MCLNKLLSGALEEELHDRNLEHGHGEHDGQVKEGENENTSLCRLHRGLVSVHSGFVVVHGLCQTSELSFDRVHDRLHTLDSLVSLWNGWQLGHVGRVVVTQLEINHLLCKCRHAVVETELVLADLVGVEHVVALSLFLLAHNDLAVWRLNVVVNVKGPTRLHCKIVPDVRVRLRVERVEALLGVGC